MEEKRTIRIDYCLPFEVVYEDVTRLIMNEAKSLDILADAGSGKLCRTPTLPSWVPDWSRAPDENALVSRLGWMATSNYMASLDCKPLVPDDSAAGFLEVEAFFVDQVLIEAKRYAGEADIVTVQDPSLQEGRAINLKQYVLSLWWCFGTKFHRYYRGERPFDAFWRTLIANRCAIGGRRAIPDATFVESFLLAHMDILELEIKEEKPPCICPDWAKVEYIQELDEQEPLAIRDKYPRPGEAFADNSQSSGEPYNLAMHQASQGRRFFRTQGGYMGIGPRNLTRGDHIVIVRGASIPFILRPSEVGEIQGRPVYTLVGEAYVHGISEGEALGAIDNPRHGSHWRRIVLN
jgi:hypothetical protein